MHPLYFISGQGIHRYVIAAKAGHPELSLQRCAIMRWISTFAEVAREGASNSHRGPQCIARALAAVVSCGLPGPESLVEQDLENLMLAEPKEDPWTLLEPARREKAQGICSFLLGEGRQSVDRNQTLGELCDRFIGAGVPLDRFVSVARILHSTEIALVQVWERDIGATNLTVPYKSDLDDAYQTSPPAFAHACGAWIGFDPARISAERFGIAAELNEAGFRHYICAPVHLTKGMEDAFTFATRSSEGFSAEDIAMLRATFPAISAYQEIAVLKRMLKDVTRMYVGDEPHERILSGDVHRGEVTSIESAILFADMRAFTSMTAAMSAEEATALLNDFFDCIVPPVEAQGGEVLKFLGDGVLAIFRSRDDAPGACGRALGAVREGLRGVAERNANAMPAFEIGVALHYGDVAYGNVGSGMRLDYTVVGRDVNLTSRIESLCGLLGASVLASGRFRKLAGEQAFRPAGQHDLKGFAEPVPVYELIGVES